MRRREFITAVGGAAAWPLRAHAQQPGMPVIGVLQIGSPSSWDFTGFRQGLKDTGYVEGQDLAIDVRWANNDPDRLPDLAADLVHHKGATNLSANSLECCTNCCRKRLILAYSAIPRTRSTS